MGWQSSVSAQSRVWHESATSPLSCYLIKLAFVRSQKEREDVVCRNRWSMKKIFFIAFELFMAGTLHAKA
jgi:hypothetical protein